MRPRRLTIGPATTVSAPAKIYRLKTADIREPKKLRGEFRRECRALGLLPVAVEFALPDNTYNPTTGQQYRKARNNEPVPTVFMVYGEPAALDALSAHWTVLDSHFPETIRLPGSGRSPDSPAPIRADNPTTERRIRQGRIQRAACLDDSQWSEHSRNWNKPSDMRQLRQGEIVSPN